MKLLVTAFEPFDKETINPSLEAMKLLNGNIAGFTILKLALPTSFYRSLTLLTEAMEREQPDAVLSLGQAGGRFGLTPERIAVNLDDARIPDNDGCQPKDHPIADDGENAYFSTLPVKAMVERIKQAGLPASLSNSAGNFVCNHVMYGALHYAAQKAPDMRCGFIHVPYLPCQVTERPQSPSMSLADIVTGLEAAIEAIALF